MWPNYEKLNFILGKGTVILIESRQPVYTVADQGMKMGVGPKFPNGHA